MRVRFPSPAPVRWLFSILRSRMSVVQVFYRTATCFMQRLSSSVANLESSYVNVRGWWDYPLFPRCGPPQDRRAGRGAGRRGVLHRRARWPADGHGERIDRVTADIARLSEVIEQLLAPYEEQLAQAESMPGWRRRSAEDAIAETGVDMTRFPAGAHLASWGSRAPLDHQSGAARAAPGPRKATGTWPASWARPPSPPAAPRPAKGPATGGWPAAWASPKPRSPSATPS
jgi:hypothetical protein